MQRVLACPSQFQRPRMGADMSHGARASGAQERQRAAPQPRPHLPSSAAGLTATERGWSGAAAHHAPAPPSPARARCWH